MDGVHPEMLKALDIAHFFNVREVGTEWQTREVVPISQKGDERVCSSYWGITLLSFPGKAHAIGVRTEA